MTGGTGRVRVVVTLLLWLAFLGFVLLGLHALGGALAPPPLADPTGLSDWLEERQPAEAAFALLRLAGLATAWYLLGATVLSAVVRLSRVRVAVRVTDLFTVPAVRRLVNAAAGATVVAATLSTGAGMSGAGAHGASHREIDMITMLAQADASPFTEAPITGTETSEGDAGRDRNPTDPAADDGGQQSPSLPTLRRLPDAPDASQPLPARPPAPPATPNQPPAVAAPRGKPAEPIPSVPQPQPGEPNPPAAPPPGQPPHSVASPAAAPPLADSPTAVPATPPAPAPQTPPPTDRWEVRPGQHFWSVAEDLLAAAWQRAPSDDEVDPYWRQLVAANRSILRDPDNPDLLYPGQVITVPPPPLVHHP